MTTKNLVPRASGQGQIGTSAKKWSQANFVAGSFDSLTVGGSAITAASDIEGVTAGNGLSGGGTEGTVSLALDLNELTAADVDVASDSIAIIDADSSNGSRKESIVDLVSAIAGDGLAASGGILAVGVDGSTIETDSDALRVKDSGITLAKIVNISNLRVLGNTTGSAAAPSEIEIDTDLTTVSDTDNTIASAKAIKTYVDAQIAGLDVKESVLVATTASFTMASTASTSTLVLADGEGGFNATADTLTIDGVSVAASSRVLIKDGVNSNSSDVNNKWNGVYTVGDLNGGTCTLTRSSDFNDPQEFIGTPFFMVDSGSINGAHGFVCNVTANPTIGTDPITFYQFSAPGQDAVAGAGLSMSGNALSINIDELTALGSTGIAQSDNLIFSDAGTEKKITFSNLEDAIFGNVSGDATVAAGGALTIAANAIEDGMVNDNVATGLAGVGLRATSGVMAVDLNELTAATVDVANDSIVIIDANDSNGSKKESIADLVAAIAGSNLTATNGVLDASGGGETITVASNSGLAKNSGALSLDLSNLSSLDEASIGEFGDSIAIYDTSENSAKKINIKDFLYSAFESANEDTDPTWDVNTTICFVDRGIQNGTSNARINRMSIRDLLDYMFEKPSDFSNTTPAADDHFLIYDSSYWTSGKVRQLEWNSLLFWAAGDGLVRNQSSRNIEVNVDDATIEISSDTVQIKNSGVTSAKLASNSVTHTSLASSSINSQSEKSSVHDNDELLIVDSEDSNNLKKVKKSTLVSGSGSSGGGLTYEPHTSGATITAAVNKHYSVNVSGQDVTANLPTTGTGQISFKNMNSSNSLTVRVTQSSSKTFDGVTDGGIVLSHKEAVTVITDGSGNWEIR